MMTVSTAVRRTVCAVALCLFALPFVTPAQAHASGIAITSGVTSIGQGAHNYPVAIQGTGFEPGAIATISGTNLRINAQQEYAPTTIYGTVSVKSTIPTGARNLIVTNPDGSAATCVACVVIDPAPTVTSIDSLEAGAGEAGFFAQSVEVHGTGFAGEVQMFIHDPPAVVAWPFGQVISSTEAIVGVVVAPGTTPGRFDVTLTNADGGVARCTACFTVKPGPRVNRITPSRFIRGNTYKVTLTGQYFDQGAMPIVVDLHGGITVSHVTVSADGTTVTFTMTISHKAYLGYPGITLRLANPAPGFGSIGALPLTVTKSCGTTTC